MKYVFALFLLFFEVCIVQAQDHYRLLELEYEYSSNNRYDQAARENKVDVQEYEANLSLPIQKDNGDAYVFGLGFNNLALYPKVAVTDENQDTIMKSSNDFSRFRLQAGYSKKLNDESSIVFMGFYRIASDMVEVTSKDYLFGGLGLYTKKKSDNFTLKYGFYINQEHYGLLLIPLIGGDWQVTDKFRIYGVLPRSLTLEYTMNKRFRTGIIFEAPNRTYRVNESRVQDVNTGENIDTYVHNIKNVIYAYAEVYLTESIVLRGRIGYTIAREIELYEYQEAKTFLTWGIDYGAERTPVYAVPTYRPFEDVMVLNASLEYRFSYR